MTSFLWCSDLEAKREVRAEEVTAVCVSVCVCDQLESRIVSNLAFFSIGPGVCKGTCAGLHGDISKDCRKRGGGMHCAHMRTSLLESILVTDQQ